MKILVVDDEKSLVEIYTEMLETLYEVTPTVSSEEALELLLNEKFDVLITDYEMPVINGAILCENAISQGVKPILISGIVDSFTKMPNEVLKFNKPFNWKTLIECLKLYEVIS